MEVKGFHYDPPARGAFKYSQKLDGQGKRVNTSCADILMTSFAGQLAGFAEPACLYECEEKLGWLRRFLDKRRTKQLEMKDQAVFSGAIFQNQDDRERVSYFRRCQVRRVGTGYQ
jgi:hypothetical protein